MSTTKRTLGFARELWREMSADQIGNYAAALSYHFLLALFPFFIFLASLGTFVSPWLGIDDPAVELANRIGDALPPDASQLLLKQVSAVLDTQHSGLLSVGLLGAIWAAAAGMTALMSAMNAAYDVEETRSFWKRTGIALGLTVLGAVVALAVFVLAVPGRAFAQMITSAIGLGDAYSYFQGLVRFALMVVLVLTGASVILWAAPSLRLPFKWITAGAVLFVVAWFAMSFGFAQYVTNFGSYNATYGTLGGVVVLMVWFYLSAYILLAGAEVNAILARRAAEARAEELKAAAASGASPRSARELPLAPPDAWMPPRPRRG